MSRVVRLIALAALASASSSAAFAGTLNDTGQVACYNASATSTGTVSGGTPAPEAPGFEGQDCSRGAAAADAVAAQVKIGGSSVAGRDYSKIGNNGSVLPDTAVRGSGPQDWGCTRDNVTGLIWHLRGDLDKDYRFSWKNTPNVDNGGDTCGGLLSSCDTDTLVAAANMFGLCGATGWTLPTPAQLESLLAYADPGSSKNLIDRTWFPDQANDEVNPFLFWSSEAANVDGTMAWTADFDFGWTAAAATNSANYVRLVLAPSSTSPTPRFTTSEPVSGEVVVEDAQTGLMWKQCPQGRSGAGCAAGSLATLTWSAALTAAGSEDFAGFTDWRLPNINELASIRDYSPTADPINDVRLPAEFAGTEPFDLHWSSTNTVRPVSLDTALTYMYFDGAAHNETFKTQTAAVRLVRGGKFLAAHAPGADTTPDPFAFGGKNATFGTLVESDDITISGITGPTSLKVTGAVQSAWSTDGGVSWRAGIGAVGNGQTVRVRHLASATVGGVATTTLTVGGTSAGFSSTATASPPGAPTGVTASRGNASATLTFSPPASDGGSPITAYTAISSPAGGSSSCTTAQPLSCTMSGLSNGTSYTFTMTATNAAGTSESSAASNPVTPATTPGAPTAVSAAGTDTRGQAAVSFTAPASTGGSPILDYTATSSPGGLTGTCSASPCTVTGLAPEGTAYTFTVRARNDVGSGSASAPSSALTLVSPPTIQFVGTPKVQVPLNYKAGLFFSRGTPDQVLQVADAETAAANLIVTVSSSNEELLPSNPSSSDPDGVHLSRASGAPETFNVNLRPRLNRSGTTTLTYTVTDGVGSTATLTEVVTVLDGNHAPFAFYSTNKIRLPADAEPGVYEVPGFLLWASPGEGEELAQSVTHVAHWVPRSDGINLERSFGTPGSIDESGTLRITLAAIEGGLVAAYPIDDGADVLGILPICSKAELWILDYALRVLAEYEYFNNNAPSPRAVAPCGALFRATVTTHGQSAASLTVARRVPSDAARAKQAAQQVGLGYAVTVENTGSMPIEAARVTIPAPAHLASPQWTCTVSVGSCSPASGVGAASTLIDLDLDEVAEIVYTGFVSDTTSYVKLAPRITFAEGVDGFVFGNGVERTDVISDAHVFVGGFEGASPLP